MQNSSPASSYHRLPPAWLTRTLRSNVFCRLLPAETTACYANRREANNPFPTPFSPPSRHLPGSEPSTAVSVSNFLTNARLVRHHRLSHRYRSWLITSPRRWIFIHRRPSHVYKPFRDPFQSHPSKLCMCYLITALFTLAMKYCRRCSPCCFGIALMSGKHRGCLCG